MAPPPVPPALPTAPRHHPLAPPGRRPRRGLGDTRTPFYATALANLLNVALEPLLIFVLGMGVRGAALAVGLSQVQR